MNFTEALTKAKTELKNFTTSPKLDSEVLLSFVTGVSKTELHTNPKQLLNKKQINKLQELIKKRQQGWPVAYLIGHKEFYGLDFKVTPDVLIPRPDSELLANLAISQSQMTSRQPLNIIDVGTGSGNLIIAIAKNLPNDNFQMHAIDISEKALTIAKQNAKKHRVFKKINFLNGNLLQPLIIDKKNTIDNSIIVANLPYLNLEQMKESSIQKEPELALVSGSNGMDHYTELFSQLQKQRAKNWKLFLEHDPGQTEKLKLLAKKMFPTAKTMSHKDLSNKNRVLEINNGHHG